MLQIHKNPRQLGRTNSGRVCLQPSKEENKRRPLVLRNAENKSWFPPSGEPDYHILAALSIAPDLAIFYFDQSLEKQLFYYDKLDYLVESYLALFIHTRGVL